MNNLQLLYFCSLIVCIIPATCWFLCTRIDGMKGVFSIAPFCLSFLPIINSLGATVIIAAAYISYKNDVKF